MADGLIALAATALITAWKLEPSPRSPTYLLKVGCLLLDPGISCFQDLRQRSFNANV